MASALLVARLVLAGVFAVAGLAKLADPAGTRESLERFGAPRRTVAAGALALPVVELGVAGTLIPAGAARWGALAALAMLVVFSAAVARLLARGEEADCNCFGSLGSKPADQRTLLRNGALSALAAFVVIAGWSDAGAQPGVEAAVIVLAVVALGAAAFAFLTLRQNGHLLLRVDALRAELRTGDSSVDSHEVAPLPPQGIPVGAEVPAFAVHDLDGEVVSLADLLGRGVPVALVLAEPDCPGCRRLLPTLPGLIAARSHDLTVAVITSGGVARARRFAAEHGIEGMLVQPDHSLNLKLRAYALPSAVWVGSDGRVIAELARGAEEITERLEAFAAGPALEGVTA